MSGPQQSADYDATCYGHWGPGMLRAWDECPVCNPEDDSNIPPVEKGSS